MRQALVTGLTLVTAVASVALIAPSAASAGAATGSPGTSTLSTTNIPVGNRHTAPAVTGTESATQATCGGRLAFGRIVTCPSITGTKQDTYRFTTARDNDHLFTDLTQGTGAGISARITTADGTFVCPVFPNANTCPVGVAGTYMLTVTTVYGAGTGNYTLSVESMLTPSKCTNLPNSAFSFASPGVTSTLPTGAAAQCFTFAQPTGSVLFLADPGGDGDVQGLIHDARNEALCPVRYTTTCTLAQPGPYRLFMYEATGTESTYTLRMPRISRSAGCPMLKLAPFGDPGAAVATGSVTIAQQVGCQQVKVPSTGSIGLRFQNDQQLNWSVYDAAGTKVCEKYTNIRTCPVAAAGDYTILVQNASFGDTVDYALAVTAQFRNTGCAAVTSTSWSPDALVVHQTSGVQTNCQPIEGNAGDRIVYYSAPTEYNNMMTWLVDGAGNPVCNSPSPDGQDGCVLPATGRYRVLSYLITWADRSTDKQYKLQVRRLNNPVGCPTIQPDAYGAAPSAALGANRCRLLSIPVAGRYVVSPVDFQYRTRYGTVYNASGQQVCTTGYCTFQTAGTYTMVLDGSSPGSVIDNDQAYVLTLLPARPTGCVAASDTADPITPYHGDLVLGQFDCLRLPTPADARIVELRPTAATGSAAPAVTVVDSAGTFVCDSYGLRQISCTLSGTAPFYAVARADNDSAPGPYTVAFARVDGPPACPALPPGPDGATVTAGAGHVATCFSVPADGHAATETFTFTRTSGTGAATLSVFNSAAVRYCATYEPQATQTVNCSLPDGPATFMFETDATDATYQVTHHAYSP
jgi:hypothetical protein